MTLKRSLQVALAFGPALLLTSSLSGTPEETLEYRLNGSLAGSVGGQTLEGRLGPGARFVPSAEGQGVVPGPTGPAVVLPVPQEFWKPAGTLAFRFRTSRLIRYAAPPLTMVLAECPLFRVLLAEGKGNPYLSIRMANAGGASVNAPVGRLDWSHLKPDQWYHLLFTWNAPTGGMETYLNGCLQEELCLRGRQRWEPPAAPRGDLLLGGTLGTGDTTAALAIDSVQVLPRCLDAREVAGLLAGRPNFPLQGEGRWPIEGALDLKPYKRTLVYEADFSKPLNVVHEDDLFEGGKRVRLPEGKEWVLEGQGKAWTEEGRLVLQGADEEWDKHLVLWNTRPFPEDFLLEFGMAPRDSKIGLGILFFATTSRRGGSIFDLALPKREAVFANYHTGELNGYHCSYWACNPFDGGILRRTTNLRKNHGFYMPAVGIDRIGGAGPGPHQVRILKAGGKIRVESNGQLALVYDDDGHGYGPVLKDGCIGIRQMGHSYRVAYTHFRVYRLEAAGEE